MKARGSGPQPLTVLARDTASRAAIPSSAGIEVLHSPTRERAEHARNVFVFAPATELREVAEFVSLANRRHQLRALFVRDDLDPYWVPSLIENAGLRTLRNTLVHSNMTVPRRVLFAWTRGAQHQLIADARIAGDRLFVASCALDQYEVPIKKLAALSTLPESDLGTFQIDEDGSYLHWPGPDVHIDLDAIRVAIDPRLRSQARRIKTLHDARYGEAIARLRKEDGLKQSQIEGLSERQVRRIEGGSNVTAKSLAHLAKAHRLSLDGYLNRLAERLQEVGTSGALEVGNGTRPRTRVRRRGRG